MINCRGQDCLLGATTLIGRTGEVRGNCYVFGLAPQLGIGGFANRPSKAQPGMKCYKSTIDLSQPREAVRKEMEKRVECDNPTLVKYIEPPYANNACNMELPNNKHLMACIYGRDDYHFLRRMLKKTVMKMKILLDELDEHQRRQLKNSNRKYVWVHQRGWSKGPSLLDADGNIAWSPVPKTYSSDMFKKDPLIANYNYEGPLGGINYKHFGGLFNVTSRMATVESAMNSAPDMKKIKRELRNRNVPYHIK